MEPVHVKSQTSWMKMNREVGLYIRHYFCIAYVVCYRPENIYIPDMVSGDPTDPVRQPPVQKLFFLFCLLITNKYAIFRIWYLNFMKLVHCGCSFVMLCNLLDMLITCAI